MVLFWVNGFIFYAKYKTMIDAAIASMKDTFLLEREDDVAGLLGLQIERDVKIGIITLIQTSLINKILESMGMDDSKPEYTAADKLPLHKNVEGMPCCEAW